MISSTDVDGYKHLSPSRRFREKFRRELIAFGLPDGPAAPAPPVTEADLVDLPAPAQRWLRWARVVGRPRDWSFCARWDARFRMAPDKPWMASEAWQYNTQLDVARVFHMRLRFGHVLPTHVRDLYVRGEGHMSGRVFDTFSMVDNSSEKIAIGELVTYLNDAVLFAPSMLLGPSTEWRAIDDRTFEIALTDHGRTVVGRVFVDGDGAAFDFSTTDRFGEDPDQREAGLIRARWSTPVDGWSVVDGRLRPRGARSIWHFATNDFCYAEASTTGMQIAFNVPPGQVPA